MLEDTEDSGDEYDYSPSENSHTITTKKVKAKIKLVEKGPVRASLLIRYDWSLPAGLTKDRKSRSTKTVRCPVVVKVSLTSGVPRVDFELTFTNNAKDHRLRVLFPLNIKSDVVKVEEHFHIIERPINLPEGKGWVQPPSSTNHQENFVSVDNGAVGVTVINRGLPEYEVRHNENGVTIYLTLLRCVGWLSRGDLKTRQGNAGPSILTPNAQCLGSHTFHYAVCVHKGNFRSAGAMRLAYEHNVPMRIVPARSKVQNYPKAHLPVLCSFLTVEPKEFFITAVKKSEDRNSLIVRFYNTSKNHDGYLQFLQSPKEAYLTNLNEERKRKLRVGKDGKIQLQARTWQIVTVEAKLDRKLRPFASK